MGKRSDLPFSRKSDRKKEKSLVLFTHEQSSICSQKQLNDIAHEHTNICRQLFAGHVVGSRPMKRKKHLHRMIIIFAWHLAQCCPYYRGVRYSGVSARRELTVIVACTYAKSIPKQHGHAYKFTVEQPPAP